MQLIIVLFVTLLSLSVTSAFSPGSRIVSKLHTPASFFPFTQIYMAEDSNDEEPFVPTEEAKNSFFQGNKRVRLGRSKDQDGKSNIWSIEPKMEVEGEEEGAKNNVIILGAVLGAVAVCVPAFLALSKLMPDPSDY